MTDAVQRRDVRRILSDVQGFAKRQPAAFLGATVLGGFAVMRLLRTPTASHGATDDFGSHAPGAGRSLVVAGSPSDSPLAQGGLGKGGLGDRGGVASTAPGFGSSETPRGLGTGLGTNRP